MQTYAGVASENIVALCDVYEPALDQAAAAYPKARRYRDFRKLYRPLPVSLTPWS